MGVTYITPCTFAPSVLLSSIAKIVVRPGTYPVTIFGERHQGNLGVKNKVGAAAYRLLSILSDDSC